MSKNKSFIEYTYLEGTKESLRNFCKDLKGLVNNYHPMMVKFAADPTLDVFMIICREPSSGKLIFCIPSISWSGNVGNSFAFPSSFEIMGIKDKVLCNFLSEFSQKVFFSDIKLNREFYKIWSKKDAKDDANFSSL